MRQVDELDPIERRLVQGDKIGAGLLVNTGACDRQVTQVIQVESQVLGPERNRSSVCPLGR